MMSLIQASAVAITLGAGLVLGGCVSPTEDLSDEPIGEEELATEARAEEVDEADEADEADAESVGSEAQAVHPGGPYDPRGGRYGAFGRPGFGEGRYGHHSPGWGYGRGYRGHDRWGWGAGHGRRWGHGHRQHCAPNDWRCLERGRRGWW